MKVDGVTKGLKMIKFIITGLWILNILAVIFLYSIQRTIIKGEPCGGGHYLETGWNPQADSLWHNKYIKGEK